MFHYTFREEELKRERERREWWATNIFKPLLWLFAGFCMGYTITRFMFVIGWIRPDLYYPLF